MSNTFLSFTSSSSKEIQTLSFSEGQNQEAVVVVVNRL